MAGVAQGLERQIVVLNVAGSIPVARPTVSKGFRYENRSPILAFQSQMISGTVNQGLAKIHDAQLKRA